MIKSASRPVELNNTPLLKDVNMHLQEKESEIN